MYTLYSGTFNPEIRNEIIPHGVWYDICENCIQIALNSMKCLIFIFNVDLKTRYLPI